MKPVFIMILLVCLAGKAFAQVPAQVSVSPDLFRIDLDDQRPHSLTVMNLSDRTIEATATISGWTLENDIVVPTPPTATSLEQWVILNPSEMKIAPGESQIVRFAIRPPVAPQQGEYRAMLWIQERHAANPTAMVKARFRVGIAIYADQNPVERAGSFVNARFEPSNNRLQMLFTNRGNAHDRPFGEVILKGRALEEPLTLSLPQRPILPGDTAAQYLALPSLPAGNYTLTLAGHFYQKARTFQQQLELRVP